MKFWVSQVNAGVPERNLLEKWVGFPGANIKEF
jgi:hypothetical protein